MKYVFKEEKRLKTTEKKYVNQLSGARSTQKLVEIHNTQGIIKLFGIGMEYYNMDNSERFFEALTVTPSDTLKK